MYRYFSTQRPVTPGSFPKKPGMEICNYDYKTFIPVIGRSAWGYIDYPEPLTEQEAADYELTGEGVIR